MKNYNLNLKLRYSKQKDNNYKIFCKVIIFFKKKKK